MARKAKIEIAPSIDGKYFFRVRASNGEIIVVSEGFESKGNAKKATKRLVATVAKAEIVEVEA